MKYIRQHIFSLLTLLLIAALSLMPAQEFPQTDIQFADKWAHWVMYGFLTLVMGIECANASCRWNWCFPSRIFTAVTGATG